MTEEHRESWRVENTPSQLRYTCKHIKHNNLTYLRGLVQPDGVPSRKPQRTCWNQQSQQTGVIWHP
ncbi:uncharacterized protein BJX67DRAFT_367366 [Aspergillus lucknowensis]|uniref:Uncharacterized protein n=1 Tax=Aspergillus lucknowensis TaxID=176173 RepID=A0ABR4LC66_9EURO